jgi:Flp pilus assembly protein TadD
MKTFTAFLSALLICASTTVGVFAYDEQRFPGKGNHSQYRKSLAAANRGSELIGQGRFNEAVQAYDQAISIYPFDAAMYSYRGVAYASMSKHDKALADLRKAIELEPKYAAGYNNLAEGLRLSGDLRGAEVSAKMANKLEPNNPFQTLTLAEVYIDMKRFAEAKTLITSASKMPVAKEKESSLRHSVQVDLDKLPRSR